MSFKPFLADLPKRPLQFEVLAVGFLVLVAAWNLTHPLAKSDRYRPPRTNALAQAIVQRAEDAFDPPISAWVAGILIGDDSGFSARWDEIFRRTGTTHLTAVSGTNLGYVMMGCVRLCRRLPFGRRVRMFVSLFSIAFFTVLTGASGSVVRAATMFTTLVLVREALGRPVAPVRSILLAVVILTAISPRMLTDDRGFQLSALAIFGLSALSAPLAATVFRRIPGPARDWASDTTAATIATAPLIAWMSGGYSLTSFAANIAVALFIPWMMAAGAIVVVIAFAAPAVAGLLAVLLAPFFSIPLMLLRFFASLPLSLLTGVPAACVLLAVEAAALAIIFNWWRRQGVANFMYAEERLDR